MGIFSSKKKHIVDTAIVRVVADELIPSALKSAVSKSIFQDTDITDAVMDVALNGSFRNFERMYRYASRTDDEGKPKYFYGLPDAKVVNSTDGFPAAQAAIEDEIRMPVETIEYMYFRPINNVHAGWEYVTNEWGYNDTNELEVLTAVYGGGDPDADPPVAPIKFYLDKLLAVHSTTAGQRPDSNNIGAYENAGTRGYTPTRAAQGIGSLIGDLVIGEEARMGTDEVESVEIHYSWRPLGEEIQFGMFVVDLSSYDGDRELYQAKYTYDDGKVGYWTYDPTTDVYEDLTDVHAGDYTNPGSYFPIFVFRSGDQNMTAPSQVDTEQYKTSTRTLKHLGVDFGEMGESIHANEGVTDLDQAVMMLGTSITTQNPIQMEYLCDWFADLHSKLPDAAKDDGALDLSDLQRYGTKDAQGHAIVIADADFKMTLSFDYVLKRLRFGVMTEDFTNISAAETKLNLPDGIQVDQVNPRQIRRLRRKISHNVYEEIIVGNPQVRYNIYQNKGAEGQAYDDILLIPLDYSICKKINPMKREELYYRSLHFVFNSHIVQKTKWYETGIFKAILLVIAIIVTVWTVGASSGWAAVVAASGTAAVTAAVLALLQSLVIDFIIGQIIVFAFTKIAEVIGLDITIVLAVAMAVYGGYKGVQGLMSTEAVVGSTAKNLLGASTGLAKGAGELIESEMTEIMEGFTELAETQDLAEQEIERGKELLGVGNTMDPMVFIGVHPLEVYGEEPAQFIDRQIHAGNVGPRAMQLVQNYVEFSLRLPTLHDTLG